MSTRRRFLNFAGRAAAVGRAIGRGCRAAARIVRRRRAAGARSIPPIVTVPGGECPGQPLGLILYTLDDSAMPHGVDVYDWWPPNNVELDRELRKGDLR
jgi:hypothetical protein